SGPSGSQRSSAPSNLVFLSAFFAFEAQQDVAVPETAGIIAGCLDPEFADGLEGSQALPPDDRRLAAVFRLPENLRLGVRFHDCEQHGVPRAIIDNCFRRRA